MAYFTGVTFLLHGVIMYPMKKDISDAESNKIKRAQEDLYSRAHEEKPIIGEFEKKEFSVQEDWDSGGQEMVGADKTDMANNTYNKKRSSVSKNILIVALLFFVGALIFAFYVIYNDSNVSSVDNIEMSVLGPVSVDAGKEVNFRIMIENKNIANLESAELFIDMPDGARATLDGQQKTSRIARSLGTIGPGALINEKIVAEFFGEEDEKKIVFITLEYRFEGSGATLVRKMEHPVILISSPVSFTIDMLDEATSNQEIEMVVNIGPTDTSDIMKGLLFEMYYPFGFTFLSSEPEPSYGDNVWALSDLEPFGSQEIRIHGVVKGEDDTSKVFSANLGVPDSKDPKNIETVFSSTEESLIIKRPFIGLQVLVDRKDASNYVVIDEDNSVHVSIPWVNNLDTKIIDASIEVKLDHDIIDRSSISMLNDKGFYRSVDDTVVWNQQTKNLELAVVPPGASGVVGFTFELLPIVSDYKLFEDVEITIKATAKGCRLSDLDVPEQIKTPVEGHARLISSIDLVSKALYHEGPFTNTGGIPPQVNKKTTYTIVWQITNGTNDVSNAIVRSTLPTYITWKGVVFPDSESVIYNELGGEVIWNAANIEAGAGIIKEPKEMAFQVEFIPSITQVGQSPVLITETALTAVDDFTGSIVIDTEERRDIKLTTDPYYTQEDGEVVP